LTSSSCPLHLHLHLHLHPDLLFHPCYRLHVTCMDWILHSHLYPAHLTLENPPTPLEILPTHPHLLHPFHPFHLFHL